jgi:hypothetical protein
VLQQFALTYPDHFFAPVALSVARQLEAQSAAAAEIRETLNHYAAAVQRRKLADVLAVRALDRRQRSKFSDMFQNATRIEMTLVAKTEPQFTEPIVADAAAANAVPSHAVIQGEQNQVMVSGTGETTTDRHQLTIHLQRSGKGWIITAVGPAE